MPASYTRIGQYSGELRYAREWITFITSREADPSAVVSYSGFASIADTVNGDAFGMGFEADTHTRGGFHFRYPASISNGLVFPLVSFFTTEAQSTQHGIQLDFNADEVQFFADDVVDGVIAFADMGIAPDTWIRIGWNFKPGNWLNFYKGNTVVYSNVNVLASPTPVSVWFGPTGLVIPSTGPVYYDDIWVDACITENVASVPPWRIFLPVLLEGPGAYAQWTPVGAAANWQAVDDVAPDGDTTYNYTNLTGKRDTFLGTDIVAPPTLDNNDFWRVNAVIAYAVARRLNTGQQAHLKMCLYDGLNASLGDAHEDIGPDYDVFWHRFIREPDNTSWSVGDVNQVEIGYQSAGSFA